MKPWELIERTRMPDGTELTLTRHTSEYVILANGERLMSSRMHGSEEALARLGCARAATLTRPCVLVGGLGMGFTLRAALDCVAPDALVVVAELVPSVVEWNRGVLGALADHPLDDPRVRVETCDVAATMRMNRDRFDAVLLDVDNGPNALTALSNGRLYENDGIALARASLRADGVLAIWSASNDRRFERRLRSAGFSVRREGPRHTIIVAQKSLREAVASMAPIRFRG
jgi:spermidine synthase